MASLPLLGEIPVTATDLGLNTKSKLDLSAIYYLIQTVITSTAWPSPEKLHTEMTAENVKMINENALYPVANLGKLLPRIAIPYISKHMNHIENDEAGQVFSLHQLYPVTGEQDPQIAGELIISAVTNNTDLHPRKDLFAYRPVLADSQ